MFLFLIIFFLVYGGINLYFFRKVMIAFALGAFSSASLGLFLLLMVFAPILVRVLEKNELELSARGTAYAGYLWMGFLFLFFSASLFLDIYQLIIRGTVFLIGRDLSFLLLSGRTALLLSVALAATAVCYGYFEALDIRTERLVISTPKIPLSVGKLTIVQISDLHLGLIVRQRRLERVMGVVREASPDLIVSTGDLVDGQINSIAGLAEQLAQIKPRFGKFAVTGNHEAYAGLRQALALTEKAGFKVLRGESAMAGDVVNIAGVDDPAIASISGRPLAVEQDLFEGLDHGKYTLLLKHRPVVDAECLGLFDLQLSGHVHKGQIFPFNLLTHLSFPVRMGYSRYPKGSSLYVSRGTGTWGPPIRFLAPPEVTVIELRHGE